MKQFLEDNVWVWAGTLLVLITLSGSTRTHGLWISGMAVLISLILFIAGNGDKE
jgi:hypothetical protein